MPSSWLDNRHASSTAPDFADVQRNAEAGETFKRATYLFPNNAVAHRNYAQFLFVVMGEKGDEVERLLKRAMELDPTSPGIYNDLALYYAAIENKEKVSYVSVAI